MTKDELLLAIEMNQPVDTTELDIVEKKRSYHREWVKAHEKEYKEYQKQYQKIYRAEHYFEYLEYQHQYHKMKNK